jgi:hypothetical protein
MDIPGEEKKEQGKDRHNPPIGRPIYSPYRTTKHSPREEKRSDVFRIPSTSFTSLGIPFPANADLCRGRVWPVLAREKGPKKEVLIHSKNQALPNLPIGIRIIGDGGEDWSSKLAMEELIQHIATRLKDNILRHELLLKDQLSLEWSWQEEPSRGGIEYTILAHIVTTLALGSRPRQRVTRLRAKKETWESLHMLPGVQRMWGNKPSHSQVNFHVGS